MKHKLLWFFLFAAILGWFAKDGKAQNPVQFQPTTTNPTGRACNSTQGNLKTPDGKLYTCQNGHMAQVGGGGSGTLTSVATGCGLTGGPITTTGTIASNEAVNAQSGTSYTVLTGDCGKLLKFSNASAVAVGLPQAGVNFPAGWYADFVVTGAGTATITATTSTIDGNSSLALFANQGVRIVSDGTNYFTVRGFGTVSAILGACGVGPGGGNGAITIENQWQINAQTGTSYALLNTDCGKQNTFSNAASIAVSIAQPGASFGNGWITLVKNIGVGTVTITSTMSTISGAASIVLNTGEWCFLTSDGNNYEGDCYRNIAGTGITVTKTRTGQTFANTGIVPGTAVPAATVTLSGPSQIFVCTTTCTVTVPVPSLNVQYCVLNDDNVSTVITLAALGSSAQYENTARTAYGTAGTGTLVSGGAAGDAICIIGRDATHYLTSTHTGTWVAN